MDHHNSFVIPDDQTLTTTLLSPCSCRGQCLRSSPHRRTSSGRSRFANSQIRNSHVSSHRMNVHLLSAGRVRLAEQTLGMLRARMDHVSPASLKNVFLFFFQPAVCMQCNPLARKHHTFLAWKNRARASLLLIPVFS